MLLGREPGDWDITTSALPEQVKEVFRRTVDTGIQPVSYTHLDVYKRQAQYLPLRADFTGNLRICNHIVPQLLKRGQPV